VSVREFWTPTRPLFKRKRIGPYGEFYVLLPGDLLDHTPEGWVKEAPGDRVEDVIVDVFSDNLQAVRVHWIEVNRQYLFLETVVPDETIAELGLSQPIPVPVWPEPEPPEPEDPRRRPPRHPFQGPWG
jgi:hypothetical protein